MKFDIKLFGLLALVMTVAVMATNFAQDAFIDDAIGAGDLVIGGFGIPIVSGTVIALIFMVLWKYVLNKREVQ